MSSSHLDVTAAAAPLADDLFRIGHDDVTGKPRLHPHGLGVGLAAALLAELVLAGHVTVHGGLLYVVDGRPPRDALAHTVLDQLVGEAQLRQPRTWLAFLARDSEELVGQRLVRAGHVRPVQTGRRRRGRARTVYEPVDMTTAAWPEARLRMYLQQHRQWDVPDMTLAGLVAACGLADRIVWGVRADIRRFFLDLGAYLPAPLRELVAHTEAAIGNAVLSHRT